jgi:hypothetical protein
MDSTENTINAQMAANTSSSLQEESIEQETDLESNDSDDSSHSFTSDDTFSDNSEYIDYGNDIHIDHSNRNSPDVLFDNEIGMYFGPYNGKAIGELCGTTGDYIRDDDSENRVPTDYGSDSDDERDSHTYRDSSGNKIQETISQKNQRITGRSPHFLPIPPSYSRREVVLHVSKLSKYKGGRYGVRIANDEDGNIVYQDQYTNRRFVFKHLPYGPEKKSAWVWFRQNIKNGLTESKAKYEKEKNLLDFKFNPYDGNDIKEIIKGIIFKEQPDYMVWFLSLPEMINRFYDIPLPEDMSNIEKVRTVFGHFFFDPRYSSLLHSCIKGDLITFVKWIFNELDSGEVKRIDVEKYGMEYIENACTHNSISCAKFLINKYPDLDITRNNSYAISSALSNCNSNLELSKWIFDRYPDTLLSGKNACHVVLDILTSFKDYDRNIPIRWVHSVVPNVDIYDPDFSIFVITCGRSLNEPPEEYVELRHYYEKEYPIPPERYQETGISLIVKSICGGTQLKRNLERIMDYFSELDIRYGNDEAMICAIENGDSSDVEFVHERAPEIRFFDEDKRFYEKALECRDDDILLYMIKHDQKNNEESLYVRYPEICDTIFTAMCEEYNPKSPFFIETLNPERYLICLDHYDRIVEYKIIIAKEDFTKISRKDIPKEITKCVICDDTESNLYTECGHMYCDECLLSWLGKNNSCPYCRETIISQNIRLIDDE